MMALCQLNIWNKVDELTKERSKPIQYNCDYGDVTKEGQLLIHANTKIKQDR